MKALKFCLSTAEFLLGLAVAGATALALVGGVAAAVLGGGR